jgi:hypothetical protein
MEKYINPTERVANKLYDYIKNTDKGKEQSKGSYKKGKKVEMSHLKKKKMFQYNNYNSPINNLELIDIKIAIRYGEDDIYCNDDDVFNNIMIDSMYTNIYYFINKNDAKKLQSSHISKSIKKLQDDLSALKDINNPNYKKDIKDRDHIIKELEKELNELIGRLHNYN